MSNKNDCLYHGVSDRIVPIIKNWCKQHEWDDKEIKCFIDSMSDILCKDYLIDETFELVDVSDGSDARFPVDFFNTKGRKKHIAEIVPREGSMPTKAVQGDEIFVPTFKMGNAIDISKEYFKDHRSDVIRRSIDLFMKSFQKRITKEKLKCLCHSSITRQGKPFKNFKTMVQDFIDRGQKLTHIVVSKKAMETMRRNFYNVIPKDLPTKPNNIPVFDLKFNSENIPSLSALNETCGIQIIVSDLIADAYYDLLPQNKSWIKKTWQWFVSKLGLTMFQKDIVLGLNLNNGSNVQIKKGNFQIFNDPKISGKFGMYGWVEQGIGVLDLETVGLAYFPFNR